MDYRLGDTTVTGTGTCNASGIEQLEASRDV
jgi:hypothetical protein